MRFGSNNGKVSIFLCIILVPMVALAGILVDASRIKGAQGNLERAVHSSARSLLAGYGTRLKTDYGLFALTSHEQGDLTAKVREYLEKNLMCEEDDASEAGLLNLNSLRADDTRELDIYRYRVENLTVTPMQNLTDNEVVMRQILEYMKYRAPQEILEGVLDRFLEIGNTAKMAEAYKKKVEVDKLLAKADKLQQALKQNLDGDGGKGYYVNGFNRGGSREEAVSLYTRLMGEYIDLRREAAEIDALIESLTNSLETEEEKKEEIQEQLEEAKKQRKDVKDKLKDKEKEVGKAYKSLKEDHTEDFIKPNTKAEENIREISEMSGEIEKAIKELEDYINSNFADASGASGDFKKSTLDEIKELRKQLLYGEAAEKMLSRIRTNIKTLEQAGTQLDTIHQQVMESQEPEFSSEEVAVSLNKAVADYHCPIVYDYGRCGQEQKDNDPRKGVREKVKSAMEEDEKEEEFAEIDKAVLELLPSRHKVKSEAFDESQDETTGDYDEIDFEDEDESFTGNSMDFLSSLGSFLSGELLKLRDEIYINEYIMGTFKNSVPELKGENGVKADKDLSGRLKSLRDTFFKSEVEYILQGNASEKTNRKQIERKILVLRFALNTLHVFIDPVKRAQATSIATLVAGWWTGGAGIPIISALIMGSWGMREAISDKNALMKGESVPFFKLKGDWKTDLGIKIEGPETNPALCFSYHDYLRLFLLLMNPEDKISRIEDLIELNLSKNKEGFRMADWYTGVKVEATVSVPFLFLNSYLVPEEKKTADERQILQVVLYETY